MYLLCNFWLTSTIVIWTLYESESLIGATLSCECWTHGLDNAIYPTLFAVEATKTCCLDRDDKLCLFLMFECKVLKLFALFQRNKEAFQNSLEFVIQFTPSTKPHEFVLKHESAWSIVKLIENPWLRQKESEKCTLGILCSVHFLLIKIGLIFSECCRNKIIFYWFWNYKFEIYCCCWWLTIVKYAELRFHVKKPGFSTKYFDCVWDDGLWFVGTILFKQL